MTITPFEWQLPIIDQTVASLSEYNIFINGCHTGAGKTIMGLAATAKLGKRALAIVPSATVISWWRTADAMNLRSCLLDVITPNALVRGNSSWATVKKTICMSKSAKPVLPAEFSWRLPKDAMVIWDEPHKAASGESSLGTAAMAYLKPYKVPVLAMSATISDSPLKLKALGFLLGFHNLIDFHPWCLQNGCCYEAKNREHQKAGITSLAFPGRTYADREKQQLVMAKIRQAMGPRFCRLSADEIPGFPETFVDILYIELQADKTALVDAEAAMPEIMAKFHTNADVELMKKRARVEFCKSKTLADLTISQIEDGRSVVVFSNFHAAKNRIKEMLNKHGILNISEVDGNQTPIERQRDVDLFQDNTNHVALVMLEAGGAGLNLHDERHERPRVSYLTPGWNAASVKQALGRIHRVNGTRSEQYFVLASGTVEENTALYLQKKLACIDALNDGDLS